MKENLIEKFIGQSLNTLKSTLENDPTSEAPLKALIDIEEGLKHKMNIDEWTYETRAKVDKVLTKISGKTIPDFLDYIEKRVERVMVSDYAETKENLEGYLARLKIIYRKVDSVILNPDKGREIIDGLGNGVEKRKPDTNKVQHLLELLRDYQIYTDDICVIIGQNTPEMMRENSYLCIEIPKIRRTIMIHPGYGEASFVLYDIYERKKLFKMTKKEIQAQLGATKVPYAENDLAKWAQSIFHALKLDEADFQPKINIAEYDERQFLIEEIKKKFPTPEDFITLTTAEKQRLKIYGKGLAALATIITGEKGLIPVSKTSDMAKLGSAIYGKGHQVFKEALKADEANKWTKERWIEEIKKKFPTPEDFMALTQEEKRRLKIYGKGLVALATIIMGEKRLTPVGRTSDMTKLGSAIYGGDHEVFKPDDKEKWIEEIKKKFPTPEDFMALTQEEKRRLKIYDKGLITLATTITGEKGLIPVSKTSDMAKLGSAIYGKGHQVFQEALKADEANKWTKERWIEEIKKKFPTPEDFMTLTAVEKQELKIYGKGLKALATTITGEKGLIPVSKTSDMAKLGSTIYDN